MTRPLRTAALLLVLIAPTAAAADGWLQLALFDPAQLLSAEHSVTGLRLSVLLGANEDVTGFDLGVANRTTGREKGVQFGGYGEVAGDFTGLQWTLSLCDVDGAMTGAQLGGIAAWAREGSGLQAGIWYNGTRRFRGVQIGAINVADESAWLQIGAININHGAWVPVLPGINFAF